MTLNRNPLYQQIIDMLRQEVTEGIHPTGARFPSERDLADRFAISRTTANKILSVLVSEGLLQHRKGIGAFVSPPALEHDISALLSFTEKARRSGFTPETNLLAFETVVHDELEQALRLVRLRSVDGTPVIYEKRYLSLALCRGLTREMASGSLYDAMQGALGLSVGHAEQRVRAVLPNREEKTMLALMQTTACLRVDGKGYLADGRLLWVEDTLFRGDRFEFHALLGPKGLTSGGTALDPR